MPDRVELTPDQIAAGEGLVIRIAERNSFFAADMIAGLRARAPRADVAAIATPEGVMMALDRVPRARRLLVIANARLAEIVACGLTEALATRGARLVVVQGADPDAEVEAAGAIILPSPFTDESLAALLVDVLQPPT